MSPTRIPSPYEALTEHPHYRYRGCAPDPDEPSLAAGVVELKDGRVLRVPVTAWETPDVDGGESQTVRLERETAAINVCFGCPVMLACAAYANTVGADGKLLEPEGIQGGERALERHKRLIRSRQAETPAPAADAAFATKQKQDLLYALARHTDPWDIATVADMDLRTANWQRSSLVRLLGLPKTATRNQVLERALERGLVDPKHVRMDDGSVPAVVRDMKTTPEPAPKLPPTRGRRPARSKFACIEGQLGFDDLAAPEATVHTLIPAKRLEAAA